VRILLTGAYVYVGGDSSEPEGEGKGDAERFGPQGDAAALAGDDGWIYGYLYVRDTRIAAVAPGDPPPELRAEAERVLFLGGRLVLPGLVNTHTHTPMTLLRGMGEGRPLKAWLEEEMWPREARFTDASVYWGTRLAQLEMIQSGVTTFNDMYDRMHLVLEAVGESGLRAVLGRGVIGLAPKDVQDAKLREAVEFARTAHGAYGGRVRAMIAPHAPYTVPEPLLVRMVEAAEELDLPVHIHVSETKEEVERCRERTGMRPVEYLDALGVFRRPTLAVHAVHLSEAEKDLLAARGVRVSHNPVSNLKLGSGVADVPGLLARGVIVGLGTDGAASNNRQDIFHELTTAALLHKGIRHEAEVLPPPEAFALATRMGARALFLEDIGALRTGWKADLIVLDAANARYVPRTDLLAHVVYNALPADVTHVMVDGRFLMEEREVLTLDAERILYEAEREAQRLR